MRLKFALIVCLIVCCAKFAVAQQQRFGSSMDFLTMSRFIDPPRLLRQALRDAEEAIEQKQYSEAVVKLGDLLQREADAEEAGLNNQDFFLDIKDTLPQRANESYFRHCHDLIGTLPDPARKTYELRYGPLAKQMLESATKTRDWEKLRAVRRMYFHTTSGYQASLLLAQRELFLGHPLSASLLLDRVVESSVAVNQLGEELIALHAVACRLSGRSVPGGVWEIKNAIKVGDATAAVVEDWRSWIDANYEFSRPDSLTSATDYPYLGGGSSRNETSDGQLPISSERYLVPTWSSSREEQDIPKKRDELAASGKLVPPSWSPILVGGQLLMRTTKGLFGIEHRTGRRVWPYPWYETSDTTEKEDSMVPLGRGQLDPSTRLMQSVWNDVPHGQITSDGKRVFFLYDLSPAQKPQINPLMGIRGNRAIDGGSNTLIALELATEGKTLWKLGKNPTVVSELNDAFFLGAPLPIDGYLYSIIEMDGDIALVCLNPATGALEWQQQLVANEGWGVQYNPLRRIAGATPTYHEGVLICPTGAGATVAIDLADRMLRWGVTYPRKADYTTTTNRGQMQDQSTEELLHRWHSPAAIASGQSVIITPVETDQLLCFELIDGKRRFSKPRDGAFYASGIRDERFLVVGAQQIRSFDLEKGKLEWASKPDQFVAGQQVVGRGVFSADSYIVPASGNELIRFSLEDGSVSARRRVKYPLGNLVAINGEILSQSPTALVVASGEESLATRVDQILKENPNDVNGLVNKALLLIESDRRSEALDVLEQARQLDPESDEVFVYSVDAMLGMLRADETLPDDFVTKLDQLVSNDLDQRVQFLAIQLQAALRRRSVEDSMERLLELSSAREGLQGDDGDKVLGDPTRKCSLDGWLSARCGELALLAAEEGKLEWIQNSLASHLEQKRFGSARSLQRLIEHFRPLGVDELVQSVSQRFVNEDNHFVAERLLIGTARPESLLIGSDSTFSPRLAEALCRVYGTARFGPDALAVLRSLEEQGIDADTTTELETLAESGIDPGAESLTVDGTVNLAWQNNSMPGAARIGATQKLVRTMDKGGNTFAGWSVINLSGAALLQKPLGERQRFAADIRTGVDSFASISGGLLLLERPGQISALNLFAIRENRIADADLWKRDFGSEGNSVTQRRPEQMPLGDTIYRYPTNSKVSHLTSEFRVGPILGDRILVLQAGDLMAIGSTNGQQIWRNSNAPTQGQMVVDGDRVAVVSSRKTAGAEMHLFHLTDGRRLGESPWSHGDVWTTAGKHVLAYQTLNNGADVLVRLIDPFNDKIILEQESKSNRATNVGQRGFGRVVRNRFMVLMDATGNVTVWDLVKGVELCQHQTGEVPKLETVRAMRMKDRLLILAANEITRVSARDMNTRVSDKHHTVHRMISISTETGELEWQREFEKPWGCTIDQPYGSPVIVMARSKSVFAANRSPNVQMDVEMLRLNDGKTIHQVLERELGPRNSGLVTRLIVQPLQNRVIAQIGSETLLYQFSDKPPANGQRDDDNAEDEEQPSDKNE